MGYTHYWDRPHTIDLDIFQAIRSDFERLVLPLSDASVSLAGGLGEGLPVIADDQIWFNGVAECGHPANEDIVIPYPSEDAHGVGPSSTALDESCESLIARVKHRCCNGCCRYETFDFPRSLTLSPRGKPDENGLYTGFTKTGFRPYDIAVTAALLIAKRHLKDRFQISTEGAEAQWSDAKRICQDVLGYGDWFGIVEKIIEEEWPDGTGEKHTVHHRTLIEVDPSTLF